MQWQEMTDSERETEYSPSSCLPDGDYLPFVENYREQSRESWVRVRSSDRARASTISYGDSDSQTIDVAVPTEQRANVPLLAFFHGGYWQELSKVDSHFPAWDCIERGWAYAAIDYTLAPDADVSTIVAECRSAIGELQSQADSLGFDATQIFVAGSSAGAHLAAMAALGSGRRTDSIAGAVLVSGIFELEPLIGTSINEALGLDAAEARINSPANYSLGHFPPAVIAYGENETREFKAQSTEFAEHLRNAGVPVVVHEVLSRNHFDVINDLAAFDTKLGDAVASLIKPKGVSDAHL